MREYSDCNALARALNFQNFLVHYDADAVGGNGYTKLVYEISCTNAVPVEFYRSDLLLHYVCNIVHIFPGIIADRNISSSSRYRHDS